MLLHKKEEEEWALRDTTKMAIRETKLASLISRYFHLIISLAIVFLFILNLCPRRGKWWNWSKIKCQVDQFRALFTGV